MGRPLHARLTAAVGLLLVGCIAKEPAGPPVVLLSISGAGSPALADAMDGGRVALLEADGARPTWQLLAALVLGDEPPGSIGGAPPRIAGSATTLAELATAFGHETAMFLQGRGLTEESGLLQGGFQTLDGPTLALLATGDPGRLAADELLAFVGDKLPRPMEDAPFAWAHLDLAGIPPEEARARAAELWRLVLERLEPHPEALAVAVALPTATLPGAVVFQGAGVVPSRAGLPLPIVDLAPTIAGLAALPGSIGRGTDHSESLRR